MRPDDVRGVALSVDDEAASRALIDKHRLSFPVGHSADAHAIAAATGAFVNPDATFRQCTGFVLDQTGACSSACTPAAPLDDSYPTTSSE